MVEQEKGPAQIWFAVSQVNACAPLGQMVGGRHSSQARADDKDGGSEILAHSTASSIASTCAEVRLRTVVALLRQTTAQAPHPWHRAALTVASVFQG